MGRLPLFCLFLLPLPASAQPKPKAPYRDKEAALKLWFAINQGGLGQFLYRMAPPDRL